MTTFSDAELRKALQRDLKPHATGVQYQAGVQLLLWHEHWLRRKDFLDAAVSSYTNDDGQLNVTISWRKAREAFDRGDFDRASTSELAVLDLAIALGTDRFRFNIMGDAHASAVLNAVRTALGLPEAGGR